MLFALPPRQLSPYKEWERKNRIKVHFAAHCEEDPWFACRTITDVGTHASVHGDRWSTTGLTRDEAIAALCKKLNIPVFGA
jgi:hypothetical protein